MLSYAQECVHKHVQEQYGDNESAPAIPIRIMQQNLSKTVKAFTKCHAEDLSRGWEVLLQEEQLKFSLPAADGGAPLLFDMRVDRVDRHRDTGRMRVIDYKTNATPPGNAHWEKLSDQAAALYQQYMPASFTVTDEKGNTRRRSSVQLPLYAEAIRQIYNLPELPETAFYNMPRNAPGTVAYNPMGGVETKSDMTEELHDQTMHCVQEAAVLMRAGMCLYSAESLGRTMPYDNFGALSIYKDPDPRVLCSLPRLKAPATEQQN